MFYINDKEVPVTCGWFAFDGCHKIYLIESDTDYDAVCNGAYGWSKNDLYPICSLPVVWKETCPFRFIYSWDLETRYVPQCYESEYGPVRFEWR